MANALPASEPIPQDAQKRLAAELRAVLSRGCLLESEEERRPYECDGLSAYRQLPLLELLQVSIRVSD